MVKKNIDEKLDNYIQFHIEHETSFEDIKKELIKLGYPDDMIDYHINLYKEKADFVKRLKDPTANPAPLGLMAFGMTTVLLNIHNAGFFPINSMILTMGVFYGGLAQVLAGFMEWKKGNTFGTTAFTSYGFFWLSLVGLLIFPKFGIADTTSSFAMGLYLSFWGLFTFALFIGTLKLSRSLQIVFSTLTVLFILLAVSDFTGSVLIRTIAGYEGIVCGVSAMYTSLALVLNEVYKKKILPV
jgi:hypothetical protein